MLAELMPWILIMKQPNGKWWWETDMNLKQRVPGELNCFKVQKDQEVLRQSRSFNSLGVTVRGEWGKKIH